MEVHAFTIGSVAAFILIVGWGFDLPLVASLVPGFPTMKPGSCVALMLLSLACLTSVRTSSTARTISVALAASVPLLLLLLYILFPPGEGRPEWALLPATGPAFCLCCAAVSLVLVNLRPDWNIAIAAIALAGCGPALYRFFALILFRGELSPVSGPFDTMALPTAILILWFLIACVLLHPALGFAAAVFQRSLRGRMLRRIFPIVCFLPIGAAAIGLALSLLFGWPIPVLLAMSATLSVIIGAGAVWRISAMLERLQAEANAHAASLSRANEALDRYAAMAAHDLKAPARHVLVYADFLDAALDKGDLEGVRRFAGRIRDAAADLPAMVDRMLTYSQSAYTRLHLSECLLSELAQGAASMLAADLEASDARITLERDARLHCDAALMTTVLQNLIANSLRYRRKGVKPEIVIDAHPDGQLCRITVADNGKGFDSKLAGVVFNPLARAENGSEGGTGIGLATCRTIVHSHGGTIRIDPASEGGALVEFTIPLATPAGIRRPNLPRLGSLLRSGPPRTPVGD